LSKLNVGDFESVATLTESVTFAMRLAITHVASCKTEQKMLCLN